MSGYILVKGMNRELTDDERKRIAEWWEANPDKNLAEVTQQAVVRSVVSGLHEPTSAPG